MAKRFTGKNRQAARFLGIAPEKFVDPGFCLGCGEANCECNGDSDYGYDRNDCPRCGGEGFISYLEAGPDVWGEDCPSEKDHLVTCPDCRGTGIT